MGDELFPTPWGRFKNTPVGAFQKSPRGGVSKIPRGGVSKINPWGRFKNTPMGAFQKDTRGGIQEKNERSKCRSEVDHSLAGKPVGDDDRRHAAAGVTSTSYVAVESLPSFLVIGVPGKEARSTTMNVV